MTMAAEKPWKMWAYPDDGIVIYFPPEMAMENGSGVNVTMDVSDLQVFITDLTDIAMKLAASDC